MDSIIKELIEIDAAAEEKVSAAKARLKKARELLESEKNALSGSKREELERQIEAADKAAAGNFEARAADLDREFEEAKARLETRFKENKARWAEKLERQLTIDN